MRIIYAQHGACLQLGHQGEQGAVCIVFDLSEYRKTYGEGTPQLLVRRPTESAPYLAALAVEGDAASWTVSAADSAIDGFGACELQWAVENTLVKSEVFETYVTPSLAVPSAEPPAAAADWVNAVVSAAQSVLAAAEAQKVVVKTEADDVAEAGTQYYLGTQSTVSIVLPQQAEAGDLITCVFYSGATAATLSVTGAFVGALIVPKANERIELNMLYDGENWAIVSNAMGVSA